MFTKYIGKIGNYEAECVQEVLDLTGGDVHKGQALVLEAIDTMQQYNQRRTELALAETHNQSWLTRLRLRRRLPEPEVAPLPSFVQAVACITFASPRWWWDGIEKLGLRHLYT